MCVYDGFGMNVKIVMPRHKHIQRSKFSPVDETKWRLGNYCHKLIILLFYIWDFSANFDLVLYPILVCLLNVTFLDANMVQNYAVNLSANWVLLRKQRRCFIEMSAECSVRRHAIAQFACIYIFQIIEFRVIYFIVEEKK